MFLRKLLFIFPSFTLIFISVFSFAGSNPVYADNGSLVSLINAYRASKGVAALVEDQKLTDAACWLGNDMASHQNMDHTDSFSRDMPPRLAAFGVTGGSRGENIAKTYHSTSGQTVIDLWKNSPGHNTIMLDPVYTRIGVGIGTNGDYSYWSADFASRTASTFTLACGAPAYTTPYPTPAKPKTSPSQPVPVPVVTQTTPTTVALPEPQPELAVVATRASTKTATQSSRKPSLSTVSAPASSIDLFKGLAVTSLLTGNAGLFSFVLLKLFRYFH